MNSDVASVSSKKAAHADVQHRGVIILCPRAEEFGCTQHFTTNASAKSHADEVQSGLQLPCPCAEEGCKQTFATSWRAERHADTQHRGLGYPCPLAEDEGCEKTFYSRGKAKKHANSVHCDLKVPCPLADEECDGMFCDKWYAERHADKAHRGLRKEVLCTMAEEYGVYQDVLLYSKSQAACRFCASRVEAPLSLGQRIWMQANIQLPQRCSKACIYSQVQVEMRGSYVSESCYEAALAL